MRDSLTELIIILDKSGSMENIEQDMIGSLNTLLDEQRKEPGEIRVTYTRFDTHIDHVFSGRPINEVEKIDFHSEGGTALYDAIMETLDNVGRRLHQTPESDRPSKVVCVIVTDGGENSSQKYPRFKKQEVATPQGWGNLIGRNSFQSVLYGGAKVKEAIEHQRDKYNWVFTFLGANQDAITAGNEIGISSTHSANFVATAGGVSNVGKTLSNKIRDIRGMNATQYANVNKQELYTAIERTEMEDKANSVA